MSQVLQVCCHKTVYWRNGNVELWPAYKSQIFAGKSISNVIGFFFCFMIVHLFWFRMVDVIFSCGKPKVKVPHCRLHQWIEMVYMCSVSQLGVIASNLSCETRPKVQCHRFDFECAAETETGLKQSRFSLDLSICKTQFYCQKVPKICGLWKMGHIFTSVTMGRKNRS